jgi:hypothetical protein
MKENKGWQVLTPNGWMSFAGIRRIEHRKTLNIVLEDGKSLQCTDDHRLFSEGKRHPIQEFQVGRNVDTQDGESTVAEISVSTSADVYDLVHVDGDHSYFTNGIVSSNCEFVGYSESLISGLVLKQIMEEVSNKKPISRTGEVQWFKRPERGNMYLVALDPSLGTGGDFAAIQVYELPGMAQVAEWQSKIADTPTQIRNLRQILSILDTEMRRDGDNNPEIYWSLENNTLGEAALVIIDELGEHNFDGTFLTEARKTRGTRIRRGFNTTNRSKLKACSKLKTLVEKRAMTINSKELARQLNFYVAAGAGFAAKLGQHDDLVAATLLVIRMLEMVMHYNEEQTVDLRESFAEEEVQPMGIFF